MMTAILNHLWQSTLFAAAMAMATLAFRSNRARVRHAMWLAATLKFLIPFSLLVSLGSQVEWRKAPPAIPTPVAVMIDDLRTAPVIALTPRPFTPAPTRQINWPLAIWACGFAAFSSAWLVRWRRVRAIVRAATPLVLPLPIRAAQSTALIEPGVYGIFRPILLLPAGIAERLSPSQLDTVIQHELCHVQRGDNLIAVIQMFIETVFWFHPLVWWIGKRMIAERERACDEAVLESGSRPQVYAEAILNVCKLYVESPMPCVAGVTGAGLKQRIEAIVAHRIGTELSRAKKMLLAICAAGTVVTPVAIGIMNAPTLSAQSPDAPKEVPKWEAVSIHPCDSNRDPGRSGGNAKGGGSVGRGPGRININCQTPMQLMQQAYGAFSDGRRMSFNRATFEGAPAWINTERFAIEGKAETPEGRIMMQGPMMQQLLAERFKLKMRRETREIPVYNLVVVKPGSKYITPAKAGGCTPLNMEPGGPFPDKKTKLCEMIGRGVLPGEAQGQFQGYGFTMDRFAEQLGALVGRPVIDKTGLSGTFDIEVPLPLEDLTLEKDPHRDGERYRDEDMIYSAIRHLGMRLESSKGPGIVYVIESIERPTDNFTPPLAQENPASRFEVASVKENRSGALGQTGESTPGRYSARNAPLRGLIMDAYEIDQRMQLTGGPGWIETARFDIEAKAPDNADRPTVHRMLQALLAERFQLVVHHEMKETPVYFLVVAKGGPKLRDLKSASDRTPAADTRLVGSMGAFVGLKLGLTRMLGRMVIDKTGITGSYDMRLELRTEDYPPVTAGSAQMPASVTAGAAVLAAIEPQLGLKLESGRAPVDILVIDSVSKPSSN